MLLPALPVPVAPLVVTVVGPVVLALPPTVSGLPLPSRKVRSDASELAFSVAPW